jgi:hypothetical protein
MCTDRVDTAGVALTDEKSEWPQPLSAREREVFGRVLDAMEQAGIPCMIAGAFGLHHYTGLWRNTKDMDLVVLPRDREAACQALRRAGMRDYYDVEPYDREWIFRSHDGADIVDVIWRLANKVDDVDERWFARGPEGEFAGRRVRFVPPEELIWMKLFVLQAERCDWPDIINLIRATQGQIDWERLLELVGPHWRLLRALVEIFDWLCPKEQESIPRTFRRELERRRRQDLDRDSECRNVLLDSRPWLAIPGGGSTEENHPWQAGDRRSAPGDRARGTLPVDDERCHRLPTAHRKLAPSA